MNQNRCVLIFACFGAGLFYTTPAFAYLDPGTGSIILQGLIAAVAGAVVVGKLYWERLKQFFANLTSRNKDETENQASANKSAKDESAE